MSEGDLGNIMERAQKMQGELAELQQRLAARSFEGASGGGMVKAKVSGALRVLRIEIEEDLVKGGDGAMIADLVAAAVNAALTYAQSSVQQEIQRFQTSMLAGTNLPGLFPGGSSGTGGGG